MTNNTKSTLAIYLKIIVLLVVELCTISSANAFKPFIIIEPFTTSITLAPNSASTLEVILQNNTNTNITITDFDPKISPNTLFTATVSENSCNTLTAGGNCNTAIRIQSGNTLSSASLTFIACSFNGSICSRKILPVTISSSPLTEISVFPSSTSIANGTSQQFSAIGLYRNEATQDVTQFVTWSSSDTTKATISNQANSQGMATGVNPGSSTITAKLGLISGSTTLNISNATLSTITVTPTNPSIANGIATQFSADGIFSDGHHQDLTTLVTWNSSNSAKATISNSIGTQGKASPLAVGETIISATFGAITGNSTLTITPATLASISVTPTNPSVPIGLKQQFAATGILSDNTTIDITGDASWSSAMISTAIVSNLTSTKGLATGINQGTTSISAALQGISGSTNITTTPATLNSIDISPRNASLNLGLQIQYTANGVYSDLSIKDITNDVIWTSSSTNVATISQLTGSEGLTTSASIGITNISATLNGIVDTTPLTINAASLQSITITPNTPTIAKGTLQQFTATGTYSDATTQDITNFVTWTSSASNVATISNSTGTQGRATSLTTGNSTITASLNGVSGNTTLTVSAATLSSIAITPANPIIPKTTDKQFIATGTFSDLTTKDITLEATWTSSNIAIATISNATPTKGIATGVANGSITVTAFLSSISGNTTASVTTVSIGDNLDGGIVGCLQGGLNSLIVASNDNATDINWGGAGTTTNAQSTVNGTTNTSTIVSILGASTGYAAGLCDAYEVDSAGNTPCIGGNTCYNDWFLPSITQLTCFRSNRNAIGGFSKEYYWSSSESTTNSSTNAIALNFKKANESPLSNTKTTLFSARCARLIGSSN